MFRFGNQMWRFVKKWNDTNEINESVQFSIGRGRVYLLSIVGTKSIKLKFLSLFFFFVVRECSS